MAGAVVAFAGLLQMSGERAGWIIAGETTEEALDVAKFQRRQLDLPRHAIELTLQSQAAGKRSRPRGLRDRSVATNSGRPAGAGDSRAPE